jgi:hypothetical protein
MSNPMHNLGDVSDAAQVLEQDTICRNLIQSSPNLAYACLLIRSGRHELASHAIQTLNGDKDGPNRQIALYLQSQIAIETRRFENAKASLVAHLEENPGDIVALSLLQAAIHAELSQPSSDAQAEAEDGEAVEGGVPDSTPVPEPVLNPQSEFAVEAGKSHWF